MFTAIAGLVMIGVLVLVHEAGRFVIAKLFGVGVPVFSIGMGPRLFGFVYRGTDYRISALPVGGYVQMAGADPFGEQDDSQAVPPDLDFMRKPVWQRLLIMAAGPAVNLMLPFVLFTGLFMAGKPETGPWIGTVFPASAAAEAGLRVGDKVTAVDGAPVEVWRDVRQALDARLARGGAFPVTVERDGQPVTVTLPADALFADRFGTADDFRFGAVPYGLVTLVGVDDPNTPAGRAGFKLGDQVMTVDGAKVDTWDAMLDALSGASHAVHVGRVVESVVDGERKVERVELDLSITRTEADVARDGTVYANPWGLVPASLFATRVEPGMPAAKAGIEVGDRFVAVNGQPIVAFNHVIDRVARAAPDGTIPTVTIALMRAGQPLTVSMTPVMQLVTGDSHQRPIIGVSSVGDYQPVVGQARKFYGFVEAASRSVDESVRLMDDTVSMLGNLLIGKAQVSESVGGPISIIYVADAVAKQGIFEYIAMIGMISISLGIVNLVPVPVLDGGQILFYLFEAVRGRPLPLILRERIQMVSVMALVLFMLWVAKNDVDRWLGG